VWPTLQRDIGSPEWNDNTVAVGVLQVVSKKVAAVKYLIEDLLASFPQLDGHAGDGAADGPQPMQLDS
jgi:hypothetical protein